MNRHVSRRPGALPAVRGRRRWAGTGRSGRCPRRGRCAPSSLSSRPASRTTSTAQACSAVSQETVARAALRRAGEHGAQQRPGGVLVAAGEQLARRRRGGRRSRRPGRRAPPRRPPRARRGRRRAAAPRTWRPIASVIGRSPGSSGRTPAGMATPRGTPSARRVGMERQAGARVGAQRAGIAEDEDHVAARAGAVGRAPASSSARPVPLRLRGGVDDEQREAPQALAQSASAAPTTAPSCSATQAPAGIRAGDVADAHVRARRRRGRRGSWPVRRARSAKAALATSWTAGASSGSSGRNRMRRAR